ncbi:MAG: response regulator [Candidatus Pacebacteria bacterium]|nr:response regulator [Candidatus Paceibacterota bacterium]
MAKKVLIIEDDPLMLSMEAKKLKDNGYDVLIATSGEDAFTHLNTEEAKTIDLILLDLLLPNVDGVTVLQKIRENPNTKETQVIVFSNSDDAERQKKVNSLGVTDFLTKANFTLDELVEKIRNLIG